MLSSIIFDISLCYTSFKPLRPNRSTARRLLKTLDSVAGVASSDLPKSLEASPAWKHGASGHDDFGQPILDFPAKEDESQAEQIDSLLDRIFVFGHPEPSGTTGEGSAAFVGSMPHDFLAGSEGSVDKSAPLLMVVGSLLRSLLALWWPVRLL